MGRPPKWCRAYVYIGDDSYECELPADHEGRHRATEVAGGYEGQRHPTKYATLEETGRTRYRLVVEWPHEGEQQP